MREQSELALAPVSTGDSPGSAGPFIEVPVTIFGIAGAAAVVHVGSASVARDVVTCIDMAPRAPAATGRSTLEGTVPHPDGTLRITAGGHTFAHAMHAVDPPKKNVSGKGLVVTTSGQLVT
jgi:hypothetical protein